MLRWIVIAFSLAYAIALLLFAVGTFGWFGQETDPLSGVFLMPLGLPWNMLIGAGSDGLNLAIGVLAPLVNLLIFIFLWRKQKAR